MSYMKSWRIELNLLDRMIKKYFSRMDLLCVLFGITARTKIDARNRPFLQKKTASKSNSKRGLRTIRGK
jgi:hypothetical protein